MSLTLAQLQTLKTDLAANANTVLINGSPTAISAVPHGGQNAQTVADWYNLAASPGYLVWNDAAALSAIRSAVDLSKYTPSDAPPAPPSTDMTYQNRALLCQLKQGNAFFLIQGQGAVDFTAAQYRQSYQDCMTAIPSGAGGANANAGWGTPAAPGAVRLAMQRNASNVEKLFSTQAPGGQTAGNVIADPRGSQTNPDALVVAGQINGTDVLNAWAS